MNLIYLVNCLLHLVQKVAFFSIIDPQKGHICKLFFGTFLGSGLTIFNKIPIPAKKQLPAATNNSGSETPPNNKK